MKNESHVLHFQRCPNCAKLGKDQKGDNLAVYSDGHEYCFSCGYRFSGNRLSRFAEANQARPPVDEKVVRLPPDIVPLRDAPDRAMKWLKQYELSDNQLINNNILWSDSRQRLIFPYFIGGELVAWQGRWFGHTKAPKWYTDGKIDEVLYIKGAQHETLVLVEDIISAIKVAPYCAASPVFGSVISSKRFKAIAQGFSKVIIWLDPDKQKEAIKFASIGRLFGLDCHVILSTKDPKEHTNDEIKEYLK